MFYPVLLLCIFLQQMCYGQENIIKETDVFSIEEPTWIFKSGMSKGRNHDRQDLGIVLLENASLFIRQSNPEYTGVLTVRLLGDDGETDRYVEVTDDLVEVSGDVPLVPFVDTPWGNISATVAYYVKGSFHPLPIYEDTEVEENEFFLKWDHYDSEYALVKNKYFQLLIPKVDKEWVKDLSTNRYDSLRSLVQYYEKLFNYYNKLAGFDDSSPTNRNGANRFFLRADRHGTGSAYYENKWVATSYASAKAWLTNTWVHLHEIGHGYQPEFINMHVNEATNNVFGTLFQYALDGMKAHETSWVFSDKKTVERSFHFDLSKNDCLYEKQDWRGKLIILMSFIEKAGTEALTKLYQKQRADANGNQAHFEKRLPELINRIFSDHAKLDFAAALKRFGIGPEPKEAERNRVHGYLPVALLYDVLPRKARTKIRDLLDSKRYFTTDYQLVTNEDIAILGLKGNLIINLEKNNEIRNFLNVTVQIRYGKVVIDSKTINNVDDTSVEFNNLPNGVYSVLVFSPVTTINGLKTDYVYVKNEINEVTLLFELGDLDMTQTFKFHGLGGSKFAELEVDMNRKIAKFTVTSTTPHEYYHNFFYASVKIMSSDSGTVIYHKTINGTYCEILSDVISLNENYIIEIYHDEPLRLSSADAVINRPSLLNRYRMTKLGLKNLDIDNDPKLFRMLKVDELAKILLLGRKHDHLPIFSYLVEKSITATINLMDQQLQNIYRKIYACILLGKNEGLFHEKAKRVRDGHPLTLSFKSKLEVLGGVIVQLKEGLNVVEEKYIKGDTLTFENLSNSGVYTVEFTEERSNVNLFIEVENNLVDEIFQLNGLDGLFGTFKTFLFNGYASFIITDPEPHVYFGNQTFVSLKVISSNGDTTYQQELKGINTERIFDVVSIEVGDTIELYHAETWRIVCECDILDKANTTNKWIVTKFGLKHINMNNDPINNLMIKIDKKAHHVIDELDNLQQKIKNLEQPYKKYFYEVLASLYPSFDKLTDPLVKTACENDDYTIDIEEIKNIDTDLRKTISNVKKNRYAIHSLEETYRNLYENKYSKLFYLSQDGNNVV